MAKSSGRLVSLDIFRGITVAFMIVMITPGNPKYVFPLLLPSGWNGCTAADLVFPFFLFIAGTSTFYSLKKYGSEINWGSFFRIFRRMITFFALGLFLNTFPHFKIDYSLLRIMGVLQRIALAYGIGAFICLAVRREYLWIVIAVLLLLYWGLLAFFGGANPYSLQDNFELKVDLAILGKNHLFKGYGITFEPEGLLSTIPAICTVIIGYFSGEIMGKGSASGKTVLKLLLLGAAAAGLGYLWNMILPFNKSLWTSSFVLFTAGLALGAIAVIYMIAEVFKFQMWGTFFRVFGTNALVAYITTVMWIKVMLLIKIPSGSSKVSLHEWFYTKVCVPAAGNLNGSLMFAIIQMVLIWSLLLILYRKKIMIRL
jgi:predicted acyltransferase